LIDVAIVPNRTELPFGRGHCYVGFVDVSGGVNDSAVLEGRHLAKKTLF
jgi:hypothetical protein